jgi:hypothetical protein
LEAFALGGESGFAKRQSVWLELVIQPVNQVANSSCVGGVSGTASHLMPNMQGEAAAAVDGVMRAAINKRTDDVG